MSLVPLLYPDLWEESARPRRFFDRFGLLSDSDEEFLDRLSLLDSDLLVYRPEKRRRRRYHPFLRNLARRSLDGSVSKTHTDKDKDQFLATVDVRQFAPEEINVKIAGRSVIVDANHEEKEDEHGWISRHFTRKYTIPPQWDVEKVESHLSSDGVLTISAPRKDPQRLEPNERNIQIQFTGQPAVRSIPERSETGSVCNGMENNGREEEGEEEQQQYQQQKNQPKVRGKKAGAKAV